MKKIITLQIGQCGNQVGQEFWRQLAAEHGIAPDGVLEQPNNTIEDRKDIFFYPADDGRYIPRAILFDLEPRVIEGIKKGTYSNFFNPENMKVVADGGGAGNVWSKGYDLGLKNYDDIADMIRREVEVADALEGFILCHSIAGGTGSGVGSLVLEKLSDEYKKATTMAYSVFPDLAAGDVIQQPYNSILTLKRLADNADAVVVLDNHALFQIASSKLNLTENTFDQINSLVSTVMAATTATLRFPSYSNNDLVSLLAPLIPTPPCHFLMTGYTPISLAAARQVVRKTSVIDVMSRLLDYKNIMVSSPVDKGMYISILNIIQGDVDPSEIHTALRQIRENRALRFIPWGPASLQLALSRKSPFIETPNRVSGLMLANHTNIRSLFVDNLKQFEMLFKSKAHLHEYEKYEPFIGSSIDEVFCEARDSVKKVIDEYAAAEKENFLSS